MMGGVGRERNPDTHKKRLSFSLCRLNARDTHGMAWTGLVRLIDSVKRAEACPDNGRGGDN